MSERMATSRLPTAETVNQLYSTVGLGAGVEACFIGRAVRKGRLGGLSLVCVVAEKRADSSLSVGEKVPPVVSWQDGAREKTLPTDVLEGTEGSLAMIPGPGDRQVGLAAAGGGYSTIGVAVVPRRPPSLVTTAGHAVLPRPGRVRYALGQRPTVKVLNYGSSGPPEPFSASVIKAVWTARDDYALLVPEEGLRPGNYWRDSFPVAGTVSPTAHDLGHPLWALTSHGRVKVRLLGVEWAGYVGGHAVRGAIITSRYWKDPANRLNPGDSGCALIDRFRRVVGVLHGYAELDPGQAWVFMPVVRLMVKEQVFLA